MTTPSRPELVGTVGAIASTHWLATGAGMAVLEQGGNAFDAAFAAGLVLQVVEPHSNGLGGDVSIVLHEAGSQSTKVICGQGPVPSAATTARFTDLGLRQIPGSGLLPACVPGAFGAWLRLAELGTMPIDDLFGPAIAYAADGHPMTADAARVVSTLAPLFANEWTTSGATYLVHGRAPVAGERVRNQQLAATMSRIVREAAASGDRDAQIERARQVFYEGFVAEAIGDFVASSEVLDATGRRHRGLLTADDLASWSAGVEEPATFGFGDDVIHKPGLWSQGPTFLQQLAYLGGVDVGGLGLSTGPYVHAVVEVAKLAFADREAWYGDSGDQPTIEELLRADYVADRVGALGEMAALDPQPGSPGGRHPWIPEVESDPPAATDVEWMRQLESGMPTIVLKATTRPGDTCALAVVDGRGNMVAAVPSGGWLKSSPVIDELGFSLGTRAQTMWLVDGHPNSLVPGRRPRTTLSPTVVLRGGEPFLAFGTPGGDRQDQWTLETYLAVTEFGLDLQAATEVTHFHTDQFPSSFTPRSCRPGVMVIEGDASPEALDDLRRRGHVLDVVGAGSLGAKVCIVGRTERDGFVRAGAGPRGRQAYAICR